MAGRLCSGNRQFARGARLGLFARRRWIDRRGACGGFGAYVARDVIANGVSGWMGKAIASLNAAGHGTRHEMALQTAFAVSLMYTKGMCLSRIEKSQFLTDRDVAESSAGCRAGRQQFIDLMVERVAAGEAPSSPQPPEAGGRRGRLFGAPSAAENGNRQTMPSSRCECGDRGRFSRL